MKQLTVGSLFSGIGGIDLGLERAGMRTRWFSEVDPYASRVLAKHWPDVPNHGDITQIDFSTVEPVDVLAGGFPCQDLSNAGRRAGMGGARSGLWSEYVRAVRDIRPRYVLVENVSALLSGGDGDWFARVLGDLAALGYDAEWDCIPAAGVGAPHARDRVFVVAHPPGHSMEKPLLVPFPGRPPLQLGRVYRFPLPGTHWATDQPPFVGVDDGLSDFVDRSKGLGNAVVPQVAELIGGWIIEHALATAHQEAA